MMLKAELVLEFQPPSFLARGSGKTEGEFASAGRSIRGSAIGDVDFGRGRQLVRRQGDEYRIGVPAIQHDRADLVSQEHLGRLLTGQRRGHDGNERIEIGIVTSRQGDQNVVGEATQELMLRREFTDFGIRRGGRSGIFTGNIQKNERD